MHGSFNICIRVDIDGEESKPGKQIIMRFPLPYKVGEAPCPGNSDEKILCEAGTYAWLQENCPDVAIPHMYGFGLATGQAVSVRTILSVRFHAYHFSSLHLTVYLSFHAQWKKHVGGFWRG